jgi:3'-phosphoadenosine 5'-phosphosulfate sulfotransferase (PAPS reductase)/FAD synthetase
LCEGIEKDKLEGESIRETNEMLIAIWGKRRDNSVGRSSLTIKQGGGRRKQLDEN